MILILNNILSFLLVAVCYSLAHTNSVTKEPYGKIIAFSYALIALSVLAIAFARNFGIIPFPWILLFGKAAIVFHFSLIMARLKKLYGK